MVSETKALQVVIRGWATRAFPERAALPREEQARALIRKMRKELDELEANPGGEDEYADMQILLLDLAELYNHDVQEATIRKIATNYGRRWALEADGTYQHVRTVNEDQGNPAVGARDTVAHSADASGADVSRTPLPRCNDYS